MLQEKASLLPLPNFIAGKPLYISANFRVVMDYKPRTNNTIADQRFFIEPTTDEAERMLKLAAVKHNIQENQLTVREISNSEASKKYRSSIRADFIKENLPSLLWGQIDVPKEGEDSMPSPRRMEECLTKHPREYTFQD
jgi:hypothetical protein